MRLIDADALDIDSFPIGDDDEDEDECVVTYWNIKNAPTIPAIPVEWLKQQRECNDPESVKDINGAFVTICIDGVLVLWQKEQEART